MRGARKKLAFGADYGQIKSTLERLRIAKASVMAENAGWHGLFAVVKME